jgi:hypothetical protein
MVLFVTVSDPGIATVEVSPFITTGRTVVLHWTLLDIDAEPTVFPDAVNAVVIPLNAIPVNVTVPVALGAPEKVNPPTVLFCIVPTGPRWSRPTQVIALVFPRTVIEIDPVVLDDPTTFGVTSPTFTQPPCINKPAKAVEALAAYREKSMFRIVFPWMFVRAELLTVLKRIQYMKLRNEGLDEVKVHGAPPQDGALPPMKFPLILKLSPVAPVPINITLKPEVAVRFVAVLVAVW